MKIGELSKTTGCSIQTIRYYEKEGLLSTPERTEGNYRLYGERALKELEFIKHCRSLDIPLTDVKRLMELKNKPEESCASVNKLIAQQLALVNNRMRELKALKAELQQMASLCTTENTIEACGIIKSLDS
ncbi:MULTISPECIES: Cd(II)/Pb(II)-responsive transcriptional regulator [Pseudoalteromonas]|jgi:Cd(II)/Pb(II)-responsive transcriptional regulator|uniref:Cd(II)/Pb(II)-responsive transcriptional regulator n=5 Tax=Pseudoalteromonas TaxID=53246 RepID=A0A4Q7EL04_9GAMM|nr:MULTISPECIES: Cd(II)/Pb(II)-responsive transcriptional regulator [Pseudoalteromonas]MAH27568.1 Cd(II)/Pb(II)-responsive transcriptional regulator [Pseudoalteromonadaceae bacterium]MBE1287088.1 Cd(II)/Pb(II)-responsive transcriptional regulator [Alteromonadaceae bacterium]MBN4057493.1 Cd(II)/Pb(II)-responsive transcriptional regulator [Pseudoalteromonas haloplanktis]UJX26143.1 Cd(II)/Pb(II)-responsive transcriptional regulator [Pseudoalteromonas sp. CF6-2]WOC26930.1 Cd(II)/Pb(II)-responsive |tara:strand:+ start:1315 stop:1704 length:390 start_codon:yes stop_codon:yes gene_type:complete